MRTEGQDYGTEDNCVCMYTVVVDNKCGFQQSVTDVNIPQIAVFTSRSFKLSVGFPVINLLTIEKTFYTVC